MSYIQNGNIPIRHSPPTTPHSMPGPPQTGPGGGMGWGGMGGKPVWAYSHIGHRMLDIYLSLSLSLSIYIYINIDS